MARKITSGIVGRQTLGSLSTSTNTVSSLEADTNIIFNPNGTGIVDVKSDIQLGIGSTLRLSDDTDAGFIGFTAPTTVSSSVTYVMPATGQLANYVLKTDGANTLSWGVAGLNVTNRSAADNTTYYVAFTDQSTGLEDTLSTASDRMTFVPNPGRLTVSYINSANVTFTGGTINGTTVGATTRATGNFSTMTATSVVEDSSIVYKENINPITDALESILQLSGVTYDRKDGSTQNEAGLIAEDVNKILPNLVAKNSDGNPDGINYTKLSAYLIEAVKTLKLEIEQLKR